VRWRGSYISGEIGNSSETGVGKLQPEAKVGFRSYIGIDVLGGIFALYNCMFWAVEDANVLMLKRRPSATMKWLCLHIHPTYYRQTSTFSHLAPNINTRKYVTKRRFFILTPPIPLRAHADRRVEDLIKSRPLLFESRPFSRITKRKETLLATIPASSLAAQHAEIDLDFAYFTSVISRIQLLLDTNAREVTRYEHDKATITSTASEARATLIHLRELLAESQREKQNRLEYDAIASDILNSRGLRPRDEQYANLGRLNAEIKELERERDEYTQVWTARRQQFEMIVKQLEVMWSQIKEDKDEQDRREGMSEEEEGEEVEAPARGSQSGAETPFVGGTTPVPEGGKLGVPTAAGGASPGMSANTGATPQPVDEKEEGEEDDVDLVDAPSLQKEHEMQEEGESMDTT